MLLSTELLIHKIILTIINIGLIILFVEKFVGKFLPKMKTYFRMLNIPLIIFFTLSLFLHNDNYAFFCSIVSLNLIHYEIFYLLYQRYRFHMFSYMNQFLISSSLFAFTLILYLNLNFLLLFIYIGLVMLFYSAYLFLYIKMILYKVYLFIFFVNLIVYGILLNCIFINKSLIYLNFLIGVFYTCAYICVIIFFVRGQKSIKNDNSIKEELKIITKEKILLNFKRKAELAHKSIDEYLESLILKELIK